MAHDYNLWKFLFLIFSVLLMSCQDKGSDMKKTKAVKPGEVPPVEAYDSAGNERLTFYEVGDSIADFKTNFENLFENWNVRNIENAEDYKLIDYSYVETIQDSVTFRKYRNYFTGGQRLGAHVARSEKGDSYGNREIRRFIEPQEAFEFLRDTSLLLTQVQKEVFTKEYREKVLNFISSSLNVDTLNLIHHHYEKTETKPTRTDYPLKFVGTETKSIYSNLTTSGNLSENYIAVKIKKSKDHSELSIQEKRDLFMEEMLISKISGQFEYNEKVGLGDRIYRIKMKYKNEKYSIPVICDAESKRVIWDNFFSRIRL